MSQKKSVPLVWSLCLILMISTIVFISCAEPSVEPDTLIITFDVQGGINLNPASKTVMYGEAYGALATTTKVGHTLAGWWTGAGGTGTLVTPETTVATASNQTLYAKWTPNTYTITFDAQGGGNLSETSKTVTFGTSYGQLATTDKEGQTFDGWWTGPEGSGMLITADSLVQTTTAHTLYALWVDGYTITFDSNGGDTPNPAYKAVEFNTAYGSLAISNREGYTFDGWCSGVGGTGEVILSTTILDTAAIKTLYARWIANLYKVTFDVQGGDSAVPADKEITYDSTYGTLPTVEREGYSFDGWWNEPEGAGIQITSSAQVTVTCNQIVYAKWTANTYTITFDAQEGINLNPASKTVMYGEVYGELATTVKVGHTLTGWWTGAGGTGTEVTPETTVATASNQTLYANWVTSTYTITFDTQREGNIASPTTKLVTYESPYGKLASTTSWAGHTFVGWWTGMEGTGVEITAETIVTSVTDRTLYAKWKFNAYIGPASGLVFYENPKWETDGWHYLEAAPYGWYDGGDDPSMQWGAYGYSVDPSVQSQAVGTGETNTANIVSYHDMLWTLYPEKGDYYTNPTEYYSHNDGTVAAKECADYSVIYGENTYDDWFLPSKDELALMYDNLKDSGLGGFSDRYYWSSSRYSGGFAWTQYFSNGDQYHNLKDGIGKVRPVRAF